MIREVRKEDIDGKISKQKQTMIMILRRFSRLIHMTPSSVNVTERVVLLNSFVPSSSSKILICFDKACEEIHNPWPVFLLARAETA